MLALVKSLVQKLNEQSLDERVSASYCTGVGAGKVRWLLQNSRSMITSYFQADATGLDT